MRQYVISDIHGNYKGLSNLLEKISFDFNVDNLYFVGDLCDGITTNDCYDCLSLLLTVKHFFPCMGNHDLWLKKWSQKNIIDNNWLQCNGYDTINNLTSQTDYKLKLKQYFNKIKYWYKLDDCLICHAGFNTKKSVIKQKNIVFSINRDLYRKAKISENQQHKLKFKFSETENLNRIIIGHSTTINRRPHFCNNVINIDTGSGKGGKLTIMDLDSLEYWQEK